MTLFGNGTVRLREGLWEEQRMELDDLEPEELASTLAELGRIRASIELPPSPLDSGVVDGQWVERCEVVLELEGAAPWSHRFSPYEIPPLAVASLIHVADDLAEHTRPPAGPDRLPADYEPRSGDVLRSVDGERFRVLRPTIDGEGLELQGLDAPVRIFVALDGLSEAFVALESRAPR